MKTSQANARLAGILLLGGLASLFVVLRFIPGFDAREAYFSGSFAMLVAERESFAIALALMMLTGILAGSAGIVLIRAFHHTDSPRPYSGLGLGAAGGAFILAGMLGLPAVRILGRASEAASSDWKVLIDEAYPWASGSQTVLIFFGLGGFAVGLLIAGLSLITAGAINRKLLVASALAPFLLFAIIALTIIDAPLFWLAGGLPAIIWSVGLGVHLVFTGRVAAITHTDTPRELRDKSTET